MSTDAEWAIDAPRILSCLQMFGMPLLAKAGSKEPDLYTPHRRSAQQLSYVPAPPECWARPVRGVVGDVASNSGRRAGNGRPRAEKALDFGTEEMLYDVEPSFPK